MSRERQIELLKEALCEIKLENIKELKRIKEEINKQEQHGEEWIKRLEQSIN